MTKLLGLWLVLLPACNDLSPVPTGTCGNLVVEEAEQCDGEPGCGTAGTAACRWVCSVGETACPTGLACSAEGLCVAPTNAFVPYELAPHYELPAERIFVGDLDADGRDDLVGFGSSLRIRFGAATDPLLASYEKRILTPTGVPALGAFDDHPGLDIMFPTAAGIFTLVARGRELDAVPYASIAALPPNSAAPCTPPPQTGWAACWTGDYDRDGRLDKAGYVEGRNNLEIELGRSVGIRFTVETLDIVTGLASGDFDGDGFTDLAFSTRSINGVSDQAVLVMYGAPQPDQLRVTRVGVADEIVGISAADVSTPPDGIADLAVQRAGTAAGVAVYLGDPARDLSAPFKLDRGGGLRDVPFAILAGEFVGGKGSGIDVMAFATDPLAPGSARYWWLRGLGNAQLALEIADELGGIPGVPVATGWSVGDLVTDLSTMQNGPDEVVSFANGTTDCDGPGLTVAIPSARNTATELVRNACLDLPGDGWQAARSGLLYRSTDRSVADRVVVIANREGEWWLGGAPRLDEATRTNVLPGAATPVALRCRDAQLWPQLAELGTYVSLACDDDDGTVITALQQLGTNAPVATALVRVPRGGEHVVGDFNGDGLTDLAIRAGSQITVLLQCSSDLVGTPGC